LVRGTCIRAGAAVRNVGLEIDTLARAKVFGTADAHATFTLLRRTARGATSLVYNSVAVVVDAIARLGCFGVNAAVAIIAVSAATHLGCVSVAIFVEYIERANGACRLAFDA
jgi:hypothetical protein